MDILGWIRDQLADFFGLGPLLEMFASGDYQKLFTVAGFGSMIAPVIPLLLVFELVRGMVLREAVWLVGMGVAIGVPAALLGSQALGKMLFGLKASDPFSMVLAVGVLAAVAAFAAYLPARRAAGMDPASSLVVLQFPALRAHLAAAWQISRQN